jgi:predicted transcriptional regulator
LKRYGFRMVTTVSLPDHLHARLKVIAEREHRSMNATIIVAVERYLDGEDRRSRIRELAQNVAERDAELLDRLAR